MNYKKLVILETSQEDNISPNIQKENSKYQYEDSDEIARLSVTKNQQDMKKLSSDNSSINQIFRCQKHNQDVTLLCCVSQWHCDALCIDCIPDHTKSHNNNKTQPQIRKYDDVKREYETKCQELADALALQKNTLIEYMNSQYQDRNIQNIYIWRENILNILEEYFNKVIHDYNLKIEQIQGTQNNQWIKISQNIDKMTIEIQKYQSEIQNNQLPAFAILNKLNVEKEISQLSEQIESIKHIELEDYKLNHIMLKYIQENIGRLVLIEAVQQFPHQTTVQKKEPTTIVKQQSTKCKNCGFQLQYISDFKKHMECANCQKIKRPNQKKP